MDPEIYIRKQNGPSLWINSLLLGLFSLVTSLFCMALIRINGQLSPIWFATTLMTIVVFRTPPRHWFALLGSCFIGLVVADMYMLDESLYGQLYPVLNLLEAIVGGLLLRVIFHHRQPLSTLASWATLITLLLTLLLCGAILYYLPWPFAFVIVIPFYTAVRLPRLAAFIIYYATVAMIAMMQAFGLIPQYDTPLSWFFATPYLPLLLILVPSHIMTLVMYSFRQEKNHIAESETRFRHAMEYSALGMALISPEGKWLQVNESLCNLLGYHPYELKEMTVQQISHPDDIHRHLAQTAERYNNYCNLICLLLAAMFWPLSILTVSKQ